MINKLGRAWVVILSLVVLILCVYAYQLAMQLSALSSSVNINRSAIKEPTNFAEIEIENLNTQVDNLEKGQNQMRAALVNYLLISDITNVINQYNLSDSDTCVEIVGKLQPVFSAGFSIASIGGTSQSEVDLIKRLFDDLIANNATHADLIKNLEQIKRCMIEHYS